MAYIEGEGRHQGTLFPVLLDDLVPPDHMCRVIDAFVGRLAMSQLGFERSEAADTGRPGYDPRDFLKLYLYGYLNQVRSSRRLEAECRRNVELMWLIGRLYPDHKSISEFRRLHREAITAAGAQLVHFARQCGLIRGEWIAIDGSKFRAVASVDATRERVELLRYLDKMQKADYEQRTEIDDSAVQKALEKLKQHPEPEANFMLVRQMALPAYNVQTAVDAEHALIVAHSVIVDASDIRSLKPMADAAKAALEVDTLQVVADAGYSNGEQIAQCEEAGITPFVPVMRTVNNQGDGTLYGRTDFKYDAASDSYVCPGQKRLLRKHTNFKDRYTMYKASSADCGPCSLKSQCTLAPRRGLARHLYEDALNRMEQRMTPASMRLRRQTVEHPFATIKYRIFGHPRLLVRGLSGARSEIAIATMVYNLKRITKVLGAASLVSRLAAD
ncbi:MULTISPECIES: transposase [Terriglobus]|jgi:transposase|uniref:Transposase, IS4 family n=2 Tax=Terriglobus TaxID=392733 RepID=A0A1H4W2V3_9BACT|nr:transposase [Terriglobus roseus]SEC87565.1 transposase, IS4 family [Terriglobus roseus]